MPRIHLLPEDPDSASPSSLSSSVVADRPAAAVAPRPAPRGGVPAGRVWWLFALVWLIAAAFALRAGSLDWQSFWLDEVDAIGFARADLQTLLGMFVRTGENGPLYFLLLRLWIAVAGTSEFGVRFLSLIAGVVTVPLSYALGARLFDRRTGLIAAAVATGAPYLIWYAQEGKMYALVAALSLLSTYLLRRAAHEDRRFLWIAYVVAASLGCYLHLYGAFLLAAQLLAYLATIRWHRHSIRHWLIAVACLTLPYLPLAAWQVPVLIQGPSLSHGAVSLPEMLRILFNRFSLNQEAWPAWYLILPWAVAWLTGLAALLWPRPAGRGETTLTRPHEVRSTPADKMSALPARGERPHPPSLTIRSGTLSPLGEGPRGDLLPSPRWERDSRAERGRVRAFSPSPRRGGGWGVGSVVLRPSSSWESRLWLLTWFLAPIVIVFLVTLRLPVFRDRYLTIIAPAYYLVIAVGLASIRPRWVAPVLGLALAVTAATAIAAGPLQRTDFRSAAAHYAANRQPGDVVGFEATYAARPFTWYAPSDTPVVEFPYTNDDLAPAEAQAVMARATAGSPRVWFIEHEEWLWDSRGLVRGWLESHGRLVQRVEFSGVRVSLYRLNRLSPLSPLGEG